MDEKIKMYEDLAREQHLARLHFLRLKNENALQDQLTQARAAPIVTPIVEAIKKSKANVNRPPQSKEDVRRMVLQLEKMRFQVLRRNQYIQSVARIYEDDNLFNTFLVLNKDGFYKPPIAKMVRYGLVESLIFYGQGGRNLDMLPMSMQTERFKDRLNGFDEFYADNLKTIRRVVKDETRDEPPQRVASAKPPPRVILSDSEEDMDQTEFEEDENSEEESGEFQDYDDVTSDDYETRNVTGEGLGGSPDVAEAVDRLSTLYSSKRAGNTSLEVNNEAQDILKTLLKRGSINKVQYYKLEKLF